MQIARGFRWEVHHTVTPGEVISDIGHAISKIPVVGDVVHIVGEAAVAPFKLAESIASGARLDHALLGALKDQVKIVKDVAPYAETVVSLVPGIGTGVAAAIGAGAALAEGKSLDEAAKAAIKGALPGGAVAAAAFDVAMKAAKGENLGKAALESARNLVPAGPAQKAFDIGVAVATGEKLQNAIAQGVSSLAPAALQAVISAGQKAIASTPGLSNVVQGLSADAARGAQLGAGLLSHSGMNEKALTAVRSKLAPAAKQGFDAALNAQVAHLPWIANVTGASAPAAAPHASAAPHAADPHVLEPRAAPHAAEPKVAPHAPDPPKAAPHASEPPTRSPAAPQSAPTAAAAATTTTAAAAAVAPVAPGAGLYEPYPQFGALHAPPHPHLPSHRHHGGHPLTRGGPRWGGGAPWWGIPYVPEQVVAMTTCRTWGAPIEMPPPMVAAARAALGASQGQPTSVRGPDGVLYLFSFENGALTARPCAAAVTSS